MDDLLYICRTFGAVLLLLLIVTPLLSLVGTTGAVECNLPVAFEVHCCLLFLSYVAESVAVSFEWIRSRGELPDAIPSFSSVLFACIIAIRLAFLPTAVQAFVWYLNCVFWLVLSLIEGFTAIRIYLRPSSPSPYFQLGIFFATHRALTYLGLLVLFLGSYNKGYRSLARSELGIANQSDTDTEDVDKDNQHGDAGPGIATTDYLGLRREAYHEVEEVGGWLPFVKKFRIFLPYTWPLGRLSLQIRFVMAFLLPLIQRLVGVQEALSSAAVIDAIDSERNPWHPFAILFFLGFLNSNMCLSLLKDLARIDVDLHRKTRLKKEVHFKILNLDSYFHAFVQSTDVIKATDNTTSLYELLDSITFDLLPNAFTLVFAVYSLYRRFGPSVIINLMFMITAYAYCGERFMAEMAEQHGRLVTLRD
ncbi:hypothetical protein LTR43_012309, partial [Exophiala xenobiotica]